MHHIENTEHTSAVIVVAILILKKIIALTAVTKCTEAQTMRLVDADNLKAKMETTVMYGFDMYVACGVIDDEPTVDAEPVKHGRWLSHFEYCKLHNYSPSGTSVHLWCSRCKSAAKEKTLYCPNCGAEMNRGAELENE